jgi:hypothetical protein
MPGHYRAVSPMSHWAWTGFEGNTMRDWLQLLVVPFVLPATLAWFAARRESAGSAGAANSGQLAVAVRQPDAHVDAG